MDEQMSKRFAEKIGTRYSPHEETTAQLDIKAARWIAPSQQQQQQGLESGQWPVFNRLDLTIGTPDGGEFDLHVPLPVEVLEQSGFITK